MKGLIIASNGSGGGKTTFTMGLLKAIKNRGKKVRSFKVGPDYIDPAFHSMITEEPCRNLDLFLMGKQGVKEALAKESGEIAIIEGVMGLYDGKGINEEYSTYHLSKELGLPIILVLSPKGVSSTICAEINGIRDYRDANIAGIVLNGLSEKYYELLKKAIEVNCEIDVLGYIPKDERLVLGSRHLGLIQSSEIEDLKEKISLCGNLVQEHVKVDDIISKAGDIKIESEDFDYSSIEGMNLRIGVARDRAFSFYYKDNLDILERAGKIIYFSPMDDDALPADIDMLYLGGGYPEVFYKELAANTNMLKNIKDRLEDGLPCYAECGGLMYLTEGIQSDEKFVGFLKGKAYMTKRLQNFGYATLKVGEKSPLHENNVEINCHEFHRSKVELEEDCCYNVEKTTVFGEEKTWQCGYIKKNTLAGYAHIHFAGNKEFVFEMLRMAKTFKEDKRGED